MDKQEILQEINKTKEHLANMEKMLAECGYKKWKPEKGEKFYYLNSYNMAIPETWDASYSDAGHYNIYNCFKTREQAEQEAEKVLVRRQLEDIAHKLNKKVQNEFNAYQDYKYYLYMHDNNRKIDLGSNLGVTTQGVVYCVDEKFLDVAIQEIGEERLKKYLKGE